MLAKRIIPCLDIKDGRTVKGVNFENLRDAGDPVELAKLYADEGADELVFLDVTATPVGRPPDFAHIDQLADECFMPLTVGGGVRNIEDIANLLAVGADKVAINTAAVNDPPLISRGSSRFGAQCIVVAIDVRRHNDDWRVYTHCGTRPTELAPVAWAQQAEKLGAGEILLTSIDRDGTMEGYDVEVTRRVCDAVSVPVIASGGAGEYSHMADVLRNGKASAVAAASIYHFTEKTPREAKMFLQKEGLAIRV